VCGRVSTESLSPTASLSSTASLSACLCCVPSVCTLICARLRNCSVSSPTRFTAVHLRITACLCCVPSVHSHLHSHSQLLLCVLLLGLLLFTRVTHHGLPVLRTICALSSTLTFATVSSYWFYCCSRGLRVAALPVLRAICVHSRFRIQLGLFRCSRSRIAACLRCVAFTRVQTPIHNIQ
jgi:hypothetical protein